MLSEKELENSHELGGENPHCTYCGKKLRLVKIGPDWKVICGKCGRERPEPKKAFIDWENASGKQILLAHFIVFVILLMIFAW